MFGQKTWEEMTQREREIVMAREYLTSCIEEFSDTKLIWLAEKASEIANYKRKTKYNGNNR